MQTVIKNKPQSKYRKDKFTPVSSSVRKRRLTRPHAFPMTGVNLSLQYNLDYIIYYKGSPNAALESKKF